MVLHADLIVHHPVFTNYMSSSVKLLRAPPKLLHVAIQVTLPFSFFSMPFFLSILKTSLKLLNHLVRYSMKPSLKPSPAIHTQCRINNSYLFCLYVLYIYICHIYMSYTYKSYIYVIYIYIYMTSLGLSL